jgi:hypothetical protein
MTKPRTSSTCIALVTALISGCSMRLGGLGEDLGHVTVPPSETPSGGEGPAPLDSGSLPDVDAGATPLPAEIDAAAGPGEAGADPSGDGAGSSAAGDAESPPDLGQPDGTDSGAPPEPLSVGIVLHLPFESGPALLGDVSPLHQLAVAHQMDVAMSVVEGPRGTALRFSGGDAGGYLTVGGWALNKIGAALSISCWYQAPAGAPPSGTILARRWSTVDGFLYRLDFAAGKLQLSLDAGNSYHGRATSTGVVPQDRWVHLAATFDGLKARLFIDGTESGSASFRMGIPGEQTPLLVGASATSNGTSSFLAGQLDEVILYDRALSALEVQALAHGVPSPPN